MASGIFNGEGLDRYLKRNHDEYRKRKEKKGMATGTTTGTTYWGGNDSSTGNPWQDMKGMWSIESIDLDADEVKDEGKKKKKVRQERELQSIIDAEIAKLSS